MSTKPIKAMLTGISGFVGGHLARHLSDLGWRVAGYDRRVPGVVCDFYRGDLSDMSALRQAVEQAAPDVVFHLAGILKSAAHEDFYNVHGLGTISVLEAILASGLTPTVMVASSSAVYGPGAGHKPITEGFELRPQTHYALSKAAQELIALRYYHVHGLPVVCARTFNLLGPGLSPELACSSFARQIALAEKNGKPAVISTGDLSTGRDFVDIRDAISAYELLVRMGRPGEVYNVCSEAASTIHECLDILLKQARVPAEAVLDPARVQKNDVPSQIGSARKLNELAGWKPQISLEQSLIDLLNYWRVYVEME